VLVLGVLADQSGGLRGHVVGVLAGDEHRDGLASGLDGGDGPPVPGPYAHVTGRGPDGDDRLQHADLGDRGDEWPVQVERVADVVVDHQLAQGQPDQLRRLRSCGRAKASRVVAASAEVSWPVGVWLMVGRGVAHGRSSRLSLMLVTAVTVVFRRRPRRGMRAGRQGCRAGRGCSAQRPGQRSRCSERAAGHRSTSWRRTGSCRRR